MSSNVNWLQIYLGKSARAGEEGIDFRFGFEEALGYCVGKAVRDKDGIGAALIAAELASHLKADGKTLLDRLEELYLRHGFYATSQVATTLAGLEGRKTIARIMQSLRDDSPLKHCGQLRGKPCRFAKLSESGLGPANVLQWDLDDGSRVIFRPSGTEPKLKAYLETRTEVDGSSLSIAQSEASARLEELELWVKRTVAELGGS